MLTTRFPHLAKPVFHFHQEGITLNRMEFSKRARKKTLGLKTGNKKCLRNQGQEFKDYKTSKFFSKGDRLLLVLDQCNLYVMF